MNALAAQEKSQRRCHQNHRKYPRFGQFAIEINLVHGRSGLSHLGKDADESLHKAIRKMRMLLQITTTLKRPKSDLALGIQIHIRTRFRKDRANLAARASLSRKDFPFRRGSEEMPASRIV